jgi:hypothetical protein
MLKRLSFTVLLLACCAAVFAQAKLRLGILPFTGGMGGDGETIATLFSFQEDIRDAFTVVPRTSAVNALVAEQRCPIISTTARMFGAGAGIIDGLEILKSDGLARQPFPVLIL